MATNARELVKEHHAFYEVLPYWLVVQDRPGQASTKTRTIRAGFDIDIYGVNSDAEPMPGPDYELGYVSLQKIAKEISQEIGGTCSIEVIPFPSRMVLGGSSHSEVEAMLRIRIAHLGNVDQPAGVMEDQALKDVEAHLQQLGLARK